MIRVSCDGSRFTSSSFLFCATFRFLEESLILNEDFFFTQTHVLVHRVCTIGWPEETSCLAYLALR